MDLYTHVASPAARAVYVVAKHLGIEFNAKTLDMMGGENKTPEFLKINPSHTIPTLNDNGFYLFESRAIMTYLINQYRPDSALYPKDPKQRATVDKVLYFDASAFFSAMVDVLRPKFLQNKEPTQEALDTLKERIAILEQMLGEQKFFTGNQVTLADISLASAMFTLITNPVVTISDKLNAWYERVNQAIPELKEATNEAAEFIAKQMALKKQ